MPETSVQTDEQNIVAMKREEKRVARVRKEMEKNVMDCVNYQGIHGALHRDAEMWHEVRNSLTCLLFRNPTPPRPVPEPYNKLGLYTRVWKEKCIVCQWVNWKASYPLLLARLCLPADIVRLLKVCIFPENNPAVYFCHHTYKYYK